MKITIVQSAESMTLGVSSVHRLRSFAWLQCRVAVNQWWLTAEAEADEIHSLLTNQDPSDSMVICERTKGHIRMLRRFAFTDGSGEVVLCQDHRATLAGQIGPELGKVIGAKWKCKVCTVARRLTGKAQDAELTYLSGYVVVCTPLGATYCSCPSWRFQKIPSDQRTCKHIDEVYPDHE